MEHGKILAIMGSPGSGKTTVAVKLAQCLAARKKNVIVVLCEPFTPVIPTLVSAGTAHDISLGHLLTAPGITQEDILKACVPADRNDYISLLGYRAGESLMNYPKITHDRAVELFVSLRYLADDVIIDCATVFEADPASLVALEVADRVLRMGTADLKGVSYFQSHAPMLSDDRYRKETHRMAVGNLKVGQDWEAVSGQYGKIDYLLPYAAELEQQGNEMALFEPLRSQEGGRYQTEVSCIMEEMFSAPEECNGKGQGKTAAGNILKETAGRMKTMVGKMFREKPALAKQGGGENGISVTGDETLPEGTSPEEEENTREEMADVTRQKNTEKAKGSPRQKKGKEAKKSSGFCLPFSKNRGEF